MPYLLVDDGDGRVLAEFDDGDQAVRFLERLNRHDENTTKSLCLVRLHERMGNVTAVSTSTTFRLIPELPGAPGVPDLRR